MKSIWYGIGFSIIPFVILCIGYFNVHPEFYRNIPPNFDQQSNYPSTSIAWNDDEKKDPPLRFVSSSHNAIDIWSNVKTISSFWDLWNAPKSELEYKWEYKVKNISKDKLSISVTYKLKDEYERTLSSSQVTEVAEAGETITLSNFERLDYNKAILIKDGGWSISYRIPY